MSKKSTGLSDYRKIKWWLNYLVGPLLFIMIALSIYRQLHNQPNLDQHWAFLRKTLVSESSSFILPAIVLIAFNWGLEALKWQQLVKHLMPISWWKALLGVLAGVSFTMITPNRMGEFLGRVLYMPEGSRIKSAVLTAIGSLSQLIITLAAGLAGLFYMRQVATSSDQWPPLLTNILLFGTMAVLLAGLVVYFNLGWAIRTIEKWPPINKYAVFIHALGEISGRELLKILGIALLRYIVFLVQYWLVFRALHLSIDVIPIVAGSATMFLIIAIVPTISLAELGIRSQISLYVFGLFCSDNLGILLVSGIIWLINIILPAIAGSLIMLSVKLFGKNQVATS
ncbi:MAG TPA: lysylphosphatidylglycerol synthase transmembrane domain-containing protein [Phnomibacter sp.]|nr:lysylphosphatidylglycerol synthase transmembrane domain-containing protein [Phnomibacter sp.]